MESSELGERWAPKWEQISDGMAEWRQEHPRATLTEIEDALDERLGAMRMEMLVDTVLTSQAAGFAGRPKGERPRCPACKVALVSRGAAERSLMTTGGQEFRLRRSYAECPACGLELFPPR